MEANWLLYPKEEGSPMHPDELYWECNCESCQERYNEQLKAWKDYHGIK